MIKTKPRGIALFLTLWMLMLLTILVSGYGYATRAEVRLTASLVELARARAIAEAGVWLALNDLLRPQQQRQWRTDGAPAQIEFGEDQIVLRIQDEAGKIDLNAASPELLRALLETSSLQPREITFLLHAILDWRDRDQLRRAPGAEDADYKAAGYGAKDDLFNNIEELRLVAGMTNAVFKKIYPCLTLHSLQPGINPRVAPRPVLLVLPGSNAEQVDNYLARRNTTPSEPYPTGVGNQYFTDASDDAFAITSEGHVGQSKLRLDVVVSLDTGSNPPYSVLSWREGKSAYNPEQSGKTKPGIVHDDHETAIP